MAYLPSERAAVLLPGATEGIDSAMSHAALEQAAKEQHVFKSNIYPLHWNALFLKVK